MYNIDDKKVALNQILMELYAEKEKISINDIKTLDSHYKNFASDNTDKLKDIFKAMECDIEQFTNDKGRYEIPIVIAEIFKLYLSEESGKGSYISKLKGKKFFEISFEEKKAFIGKVVKQLKDKYKEDENREKVYKELDELNKGWLGEAKYSGRVKDEILQTKLDINMIIEACMFKVGSISELDGLVTVDNGKYTEFSEEKLFESINKDDIVELPYRAKLNHEDRLELLKYLKVFVINNIKEWKKIVDIATELREDNVSEFAINKSRLVSSEELLKLAIKDYKRYIIEKLKPIDVPEHTPEEFDKILAELGYKKKNKR